MSFKNLIFRVDGDAQIGLGHIMRCLLMAEILIEHYSITFYVRSSYYVIKSAIDSHCFNIQIVQVYDESLWIEGIGNDDCVILDVYAFDSKLQKKIKDYGAKLVCISDLYTGHFYADAIINYTPGADASKYSAEDYTQIYVGIDYLLLRKEFFKARQKIKKSTPKIINSVFLCMGGSDNNNYTVQIVKDILSRDTVTSINVAVGRAYPHLVELKYIGVKNGHLNIFEDVTAKELIRLINLSDIAIASSSTIALECVMLKALLYIIKTADNQKYVYNYLIDNKLALDYAGIVCYSDTIAKEMLSHQFIFDKINSINNIRQIFLKL